MRSYVSGSVLGVLPGDLNGHAASGGFCGCCDRPASELAVDRKSTRLNSSHSQISYAVFCLKKKKKEIATSAPVSIEGPTKMMIDNPTSSRTQLHKPVIRSTQQTLSAHIRPRKRDSKEKIHS